MIVWEQGQGCDLFNDIVILFPGCIAQTLDNFFTERVDINTKQFGSGSIYMTECGRVAGTIKIQAQP